MAEEDITLDELERRKLEVDRMLDESMRHSLDDRSSIDCLREVRRSQEELAGRIAELRKREAEER